MLRGADCHLAFVFFSWRSISAQTGPSSSDLVLRRSVWEATVRLRRIMEGQVDDGSAGKLSSRCGCPEFFP